MKNYEKPIVMINEDMAEGVYAASGGDCWTGTFQTENKWNGKGHEFRILLTHSNNLKHISTYCTVKVTFSSNITEVPETINCTVDEIGSNYVIVTRHAHGNSYNSGDTADFAVTVYTGDQVTTEALSVTKIEPTYCNKTTNVQGENDY